MTTYVPFANYPFNYVNDFLLSNNATTPNSIVDLTAGSCRDSTNTFQIISNNVIHINLAVSGLNGLDTGTVAASTLYSIYVIADAFNGLPPAGLFSTSTTAPNLPEGYNIFKLLGYARTDSSSHILPGYWSLNGSTRVFMYDAPIATSVTAGAATTYTPFSLATGVPAIQNIPVYLGIVGTPSAAVRTISLQPYGGNGNSWNLSGQVATVPIYGQALVQARLNSGAPTVSYKWSAGGGDAVAIYVDGYMYNI